MLCNTRPSRRVAAMIMTAIAAALTLVAATRVRGFLRAIDADAAREEELTVGMS